MGRIALLPQCYCSCGFYCSRRAAGRSGVADLFNTLGRANAHRRCRHIECARARERKRTNEERSN